MSQCSKQNRPTYHIMIDRNLRNTSCARTSKGVNASVDATSVEVAEVFSLAVRVDVRGGGHPHMGGTITPSPPTVPVQRRDVRIRLPVPPLFSFYALVAIGVAISGGALKAFHVNRASPVRAKHSRVSAGCLGHELLQKWQESIYITPMVNESSLVPAQCHLHKQADTWCGDLMPDKLFNYCLYCGHNLVP
jgi:hypothetical protein